LAPPAPTTTARSAERSTQSTICAAIAALVRERWGRGPSRSRAYWAGSDVLLVILDDAYTESERTLLAAGRDAEVLAGRRLLGELAEPELREIAQTATGRQVAAVLWQSNVSPALSTLLFVLEHRAAGRTDEPIGDALREALDDTRALIAQGRQAQRHGAERRAKSQAEREARQQGRPADGV
jgi:uncharacterized protein YbcI